MFRESCKGVICGGSGTDRYQVLFLIRRVHRACCSCLVEDMLLSRILLLRKLLEMNEFGLLQNAMLQR